MEKDFQKLSAFVLIGVLVVLAFFILKPIIISLITGLIFGLVFIPVYNFVHKRVKNKNLSASIVCLLLVVCIILPLWFLIPVLLNQSIQIFLLSQQMDFVTPIKSLFPSLFISEQISSQLTGVLNSFITNLTSGAMNVVAGLLLNFPIILLQILVVLFVFFFTLRDSEEMVVYLQSILPFSKDVEKKIFRSSKDITFSIIYGQILIGIAQGILTGLGFYLLGIPNALFLGVLSAIFGVIPLIGPALIWIPVAIFTLIGGSFGVTAGVLLIGLLNLLFENSLKPMLISKRTNVHPVVILLGMVGGVFFFGFVGFILGPLVLAYLIIVLEIYRGKKPTGLLIQKP